MSLEAITKIRAVEDGMDEARAGARAQAQKLAADAEREGRALLEKGRAQSAAAAAEALKQAEDQAAKKRDEILAKAAKDCDALKKNAGARLDKAAKAILGRVVDS